LAYISLFFLFVLEEPSLFLSSIFIIAPMLDMMFYYHPNRTAPGSVLLYGWIPCMIYALRYHTSDPLSLVSTGIVFGQGLNLARSVHDQSPWLARSVFYALGYELCHEEEICHRYTSIYTFLLRSIPGNISLGCVLLSWWSEYWKQYLMCTLTGIVFYEMTRYVEYYSNKTWEYDGGLGNIVLFRSSVRGEAVDPLPLSYPWMMILSLFPGGYDLIVYENRIEEDDEFQDADPGPILGNIQDQQCGDDDHDGDNRVRDALFPVQPEIDR